MSTRYLSAQARVHSWWLRLRERGAAEEGMATAEYAIGTIAAAAFAGVLLLIVKGGAIKQALTAIIQQALSV
ncbi:DUF4244 domain-containing protein [Nanchangia anserum]|uniref:DUF4244 domain-containing protein n=1 Tax=Nanchangia anserum TaxID=2692125 RepID=A0A8I0KW29_9ACTO|nr:DUF4244 domain-containing protein [Nanchangia anserum]MBD3689574.1 DUF4244 domain-containing protein [Nanchangia anserum]QOX81757.1 DUF4244 domain-containing protein [Nanchangia anserum]